jgi:multimeric flavodoxin WrbA
MKLVVLNGSPKGDKSITLQHINYFGQQEKNHHLDIVDISKKIQRIEKDPDLFNAIIEKMKESDAVLWSFPVYYALVPSQMKRFIELLFERCGANFFQRKYTTAFTTSIRFLDHTAHNYMQGVCEDLGFSYVKSYSAHMDDFFAEDQREGMRRFFNWFTQMVENRVPVDRKYKVSPPPSIVYETGDISMAEKTSTRQVLLLTDAREADTNLKRMIQTFEKTSPMTVRVENLRDIDMKNGCLGCCTCGYDNTCIQKDGYSRFYNDTLKKADVIIISGTIKDHYLSADWKRFFDRSFFNGHAPVLQGKRMGFMVSGPLSQIQNLRENLEAIADNWHMKTYRIVTDEHDTSEAITEHINAFARELELVSHNDVEFSPSFYRAGGQKIFRDFIFNTRAVFRADHLYYKKYGFYKDFPQRKVKKRIAGKIFSFFVSIKPLRKKIHKRFIPGMVAPYKRILGRI